jgi:transcription factor C subunit 6
LLQWCDHLQGFFYIYPSSGILVTNIIFSHHRYFPHGRTSIVNPTNPTCLAIGSTHPIMLTGLKDGSVWACNPVLRAFATRAEKPKKIPILEHEYRPSSRFLPQSQVDDLETRLRNNDQRPRLHGAARIIEGGQSEPNISNKNEEEVETGSSSKGKKKKKTKPKPKPAPPPKPAEDEDDKGPEQVPTSELGIVVNHEPFTRITVVTWNPNTDYGRWAAIAMGSGLVRIIDLGVE